MGVGFVLWMIGAAYVFSLEYLNFVDFMTEGLLLPLGGLLVAIFAERESNAAYFLQAQDMTRYDAVNFIAGYL